MNELIEIIKNQRDIAIRDCEVKNNQIRTPYTQYEIQELSGEINAYNDVITLIETMASVKPSLNVIEAFENKTEDVEYDISSHLSTASNRVNNQSTESSIYHHIY